MRTSRLLLGAIPAAAALAACSEDDVVTASRPPLAGVRYVHAVNDTSRLDFRMIDQVDYSANTVDSAGGLRYRQASRYFPTEAKARRIRVFNYYDVGTTNVRPPSVVSDVLVDTTISFEANKNYTLLLVGSARAAAGSAGRLRFVVVDDTPPAVDANLVHLRVINANTGAPISPSVGQSGQLQTLSSVPDRGVSSYVPLPKTGFVVTVAAAGTTSPSVAGAVADTGAPGTPSTNPRAGSRQGGTAFSAYVFAPGVAGSGVFLQPGVLGSTVVTAFGSTGVELFVDRLPPNTVAAP